MLDFKQRRQLARMLDRNSLALREITMPDNGWINAMRNALGMSASQVAERKGVSRNAVYQAERSEKEGAVSIKQMDRLAKAMGGKFVYAIVSDEPITTLKYNQAMQNAHELSQLEPDFHLLTSDERQDWLDDTIAEQLHDMPLDFWDAVHDDPN